ncbi:2190_t:CDS:1, partial [Gigaspora rosea]
IDGNERGRFRALLIYALLNKKNALVSLRLLNFFIEDLGEQKELVYVFSKNTTLVSLNISNNHFGKLADCEIKSLQTDNRRLINEISKI